MTKKTTTPRQFGADTTMAAALLSAGVKPADVDAVVDDSSTDPSTEDSMAANAAIAATVATQQEVAEAKQAWEHAKAGGITRQQFEHMCSISPEKAAFLVQHKKAIFGSKKQQLEEAAGEVVSINLTCKGARESKPVVDKKTEKAKRRVFGWEKPTPLSKKDVKKVEAFAHVF